MNRINYILPECYVDTNLINVLVDGMCNHKKGCATVCKSLDNEFSERFAIAVIDKDKREPKQVANFSLLMESDGLVVLKHKTRPHFLIEINPAIETFILNAVNELNVSLSDYNIPSDINALKRLTKSVNVKESEVFARLFKDLRNATNFVKLRKIIKYLCEKQYGASAEDLLHYCKHENLVTN